ncbi:MAG: response regulator, partial [Oscillospiraceae bacterium]|nr:response regulator [Oscillospiraceae bacterium]
MGEALSKSILIVDDDIYNIQILSRILKDDYRIFAVTNGQEAIEEANKRLPDVILLDIVMSGMDGYTAISLLKESEKTKDIPVIFITSLTGYDEEEKGLALGAADYITKPFSPSVVKLRVKTQIKALEQRVTEYDLMKYRLAGDALNIALWDMEATSPDPVASNNKFTWSQEFRRMLGFDNEEDFPDLLHSWSDRLHPEDKERVLDAFMAHLNDCSGKIPYNIEYRLKLKSGEYRHFHAFGNTLRGKGGVPVRVAGAVMDINEKKQMAEKAAETEERLQILLDEMPITCNLINQSYEITECNKEAVIMFGVNSKEEFCAKFYELLPEAQPCGRPSREMMAEYMQKAFSEGYQRFEWEYKKADGEILPCEVTLVRVNYKGGFIIAQYSRDLREQRIMTEEMHRAEIAEESDKAKSKFLAVMSHEMRTPMNAILGIAEMQLQNQSIDENYRDALDKIYNSGSLLLGIINDLLDMSKLDAGKLELAPAKYYVAGLINDVANINRVRFSAKELSFILCVDENLPAMLYGDDLRIKQILNNLLSNAFKYTKEGEVRFSVSRETANDDDEDPTIKFVVSDTGTGMSKEDVDKLFDEYSRFDTEANRATEGAGLGMHITRNLLR